MFKYVMPWFPRLGDSDDMTYRWRNVEDEDIEDGEYELLDEEKPTSGWVGVPHNNPKRDPNYGKDYNPMLHMPGPDEPQLESEYVNVTLEWADEEKLEEFFDSPYGQVIGGGVVIIIVLAVWLIAVAT